MSLLGASGLKGKIMIQLVLGTPSKLTMITELATLEGLGLAYLKQFIELFPTSTLALMLTGYLTYNKAAYGDEESTEELTFEVDSDAYGGLRDVTGIWEV